MRSGRSQPAHFGDDHRKRWIVENLWHAGTNAAAHILEIYRGVMFGVEVRLGGAIGTLRPGACADITLKDIQDVPIPLTGASEATRETVIAKELIFPVGWFAQGS